MFFPKKKVKYFASMRIASNKVYVVVLSIVVQNFFDILRIICHMESFI